MGDEFLSKNDNAWWPTNSQGDTPKIKLTRAELIAIAAKDRGVKPEQIIVEE